LEDDADADREALDVAELGEREELSRPAVAEGKGVESIEGVMWHSGAQFIVWSRRRLAGGNRCRPEAGATVTAPRSPAPAPPPRVAKHATRARSRECATRGHRCGGKARRARGRGRR